MGVHRNPQALSETLWTQLDCGLIVPCGAQINPETFEKKSFLEIKQMANRVEEMFHRMGIRLSPQCSVVKLITKANELSDSWLANQTDSLPDGIIYEVLAVFRISESILSLDGEPNIFNHLKKLSKGHLNLIERINSEARDFLWEIELFALLKRKGFKPIFEEPDVKIIVDGEAVGFACKKVYSEDNLSTMISKGVHQIEKHNLIGVVALCLDDTRPPEDKVLRAQSQQQARDTLRDYNLAFLKRHEALFQKYLNTGRMSSCIVSTNTAAIIKSTAMNAGESIMVGSFLHWQKTRRELLR